MMYPGVLLFRTKTLHIEKVTSLSAATRGKCSVHIRKKFHEIALKIYPNNFLMKTSTTANFQESISQNKLARFIAYYYVTLITVTKLILEAHTYIFN